MAITKAKLEERRKATLRRIKRLGYTQDQLFDAAYGNRLHTLKGITAVELAAVQYQDGTTPLHIAADHGELNRIPKLSANLLSSLPGGQRKRTPIHNIASCGKLWQVPNLRLKHILIPDKDGYTPLHITVTHALVPTLNGLDLNLLGSTRTHSGTTPLQMAIGFGTLRCLRSVNLEQLSRFRCEKKKRLLQVVAENASRNLDFLLQDIAKHGKSYIGRSFFKQWLLDLSQQLNAEMSNNAMATKLILKAAHRNGARLNTETLTQIL